jgi:hypothetical protein
MSRRTKSRRGGFLGSLINTAIVPLSILGMQQTYRKKSHGGKKSYGGKHTRKNKAGKKSRRRH